MSAGLSVIDEDLIQFSKNFTIEARDTGYIRGYIGKKTFNSQNFSSFEIHASASQRTRRSGKKRVKFRRNETRSTERSWERFTHRRPEADPHAAAAAQVGRAISFQFHAKKLEGISPPRLFCADTSVTSAAPQIQVEIWQLDVLVDDLVPSLLQIWVVFERWKRFKREPTWLTLTVFHKSGAKTTMQEKKVFMKKENIECVRVNETCDELIDVGRKHLKEKIYAHPSRLLCLNYNS